MKSLRASRSRRAQAAATVIVIASALALTALIAPTANAADIRRIPATDGGLDVITIQGVIEDGDAERFRDAASVSAKATVLMNSEGGKIIPALEIGLLILSKGFATAVPADSLCASACALMWLSGVPRYAAPSAEIGFHAAYITDGGATHESGSGNALVGAYLNQLGLSAAAIVFITSAPPEGMEWLTPETASSVGIVFEVLSDQQAQTAEQKEVAFPDDPMATVLAFYRALSRADDESAVALVIPEKRGKGPFNQLNIHQFFGGMSQPIKLTEMKLMEGGLVQVRYRYQTNMGRKCDGRADVQTTAAFGRIFIGKIKALDGC